MFSNRYIFIYTSILVVAVAIILSLAATLLQPMQARNAEVAKMQEILNATGKAVAADEAIAVYDKDISSEWIVDLQGNIKARYACTDGRWQITEGDAAAGRAFDCDFKVQMEKARQGNADAELPVFVCQEGKMYIVPLQGKGLWGPIWGYMAIENDFNTIAGATFGHKGETPGLGAEIAGTHFQQMFRGKKLFDKDGNFVSVTVQKGGAGNYPGDVSHAVDAISGGTITSNGVTAMLAGCLRYYVPFFQSMRQQAAVATTDTLPVADTAIVAIAAPVAE